jgi:hypothetical protein
MSWSATAYVKQLRVAPDGKPVTKAQKLVLFVLADYHNEERGDAWASLRHMAMHSLHTVSGLVRVLRELERRRLILVVRDPRAAKMKVVNRYQFPAIDTIATDHRSLDLLTTGQQATDHRSLDLLTTGQHIFPKNLSNQSFQKKEKPTVCELTHYEETENEESNRRFQEFWQTYPPRNGKRLEQAATKALFLQLSVQDQVLAVQAARNYAEALKAQGLSAKDPKRFLRDGQGHEPWRDWIVTAVPSHVQRPPPPPPKTDPIGRGLWKSVYGPPNKHGYT